MSSILTVSQLNRYVAFKLRNDTKLHGIAVKGEISNFNINYNSGHAYFSLKDNEGVVKAVMFRNSISSLKFQLENGMNVVAFGNVDFYEKYINNAKEYEEKYGKEVYQKAMSQVNDNVGKSLLSLYEVGNLNSSTEVLFIERCIRLLKPGGRLGIVLPEGVLNTTNLQSVRELFEGMAKIIMITSIPQDVFVASGATVKPSIVFFKKFTKEEQEQYKKAQKDARDQVEAKYTTELTELQEFINNKENSRADIKIKKTVLKALKAQIEQEIKPFVKQLFDYQIPIAQIEKAGITTTGAECENELNVLLAEYTPYRIENELWDTRTLHYAYKVENNEMYRQVNGGTWVKVK